MRDIPLRILFSILAVAFAVGGCQTPDATEPDNLADIARDEIWAKELAIYEARGEGDISVYVSNTADGFSAWPPFTDAPYGRETLEKNGGGTNGGNQEELSMELVSFTLNGDSAIIYYQTHMTRSADGTPVDYRYEVTHTWMNDDGDWKVLGGMARATPDR